MKEQFYHHCFVLKDVQEGDLVPIGGSMMGSTQLPMSVNADFQNFFKPFEERANSFLSQISGDDHRQFFEETFPNLPHQVATVLHAFTGIAEEKRKNRPRILLCV